MPTRKRKAATKSAKKGKAATNYTNYSLDVAFSSATVAIAIDQPIFAMGFGFSKRPAGLTWTEEGQAAERVKRNCPFFFTVFDTAPEAQKVSKIEIFFNSRFAPFVDRNKRRMLSPIIRTANEIASQLGQSAGCNVKGTYSLIGPYTVDPEIPDNAPPYKCTVRVTTQNDQVFSIDPEIIVEGDG